MRALRSDNLPQPRQSTPSITTAHTLLAQQIADTGYVLTSLRDDRDFALSVAVSQTLAQRLFLLLDSSAIATPHPRQVANLRTFVTVCTVTYHTLKPVYGYGLLSPNSYDERILDSTEVPRCIYDYNFFSPALVAQIGRAKLSSAPAWRIVPMQDGGILLEMAAFPLTNIAEARPYYAQTAQLLGAKHILQGL